MSILISLLTLLQLKHIIHLIRERPVTEVEEILALSAEDKIAWMNALMKEKNKVHLVMSVEI